MPSAAYRAVLLTGRPGIGKTTVIRDLAERLAGRRLAGFYTEELRAAGRRVGFRAVTFGGERTTIAHVDLGGGPRIGRYGVDVPAIDRLAESTLAGRAYAELYLIDEIGKMECQSSRFVELTRRLFGGSTWIVATVGFSGSGFIAEVKVRPDVVLREVTRRNRDGLARKIAPWLEERLASSAGRERR